jgi:hypothetical protein
MSKNKKNTIYDEIDSLVRYYGENGEWIREKDIPKGKEYEYAYGDYIQDTFGINVNDGLIRIDLRQLLSALKERESMIMDSKYSDVDMLIEMDEGYFSGGEIRGKREETQDDIIKREEEKKHQIEIKNAEKERKVKEREQKKLDKLRKEMEKYKDKL